MSNNYKNAIEADIVEHNRDFLPGTADRPTKPEFEGAILLDGLDKEEVALIQSTLPIGTSNLFLAPLDKGFSGSKVFAGNYKLSTGFKSRLFVFKLGQNSKIEPEYYATINLVNPHIGGVDKPIYRKSINKSIVVQNFAGLEKDEHLQSLKQYSIRYTDLNVIITSLFKGRLGAWYSTKKVHNNLLLGDIFQKYINKSNKSFVYPERWSRLKDWVKEDSDIKADWYEPSEILEVIKGHNLSFYPCIVHGDLHAENVLVDSHKQVWPIDFAFCHGGSSILIDLVMMECSLKFNALPREIQLRTLLKFEDNNIDQFFPNCEMNGVPFCDELCNVSKGITALRQIAYEHDYSFIDYIKSLYIMTYMVVQYSNLNVPYMLASLQMMGEKIKKEQS